MKNEIIRWFYRTFYKKQSILVIATVRSGGTSMLNAIGDAYKQDVFFEPHTPMYKADYNPLNSIVKNVVQNMSIDEHIELAKQFDKVVLFDRRDIVAQSSSYWHLWNKLDGNYKESYVPKEISKRDLSQIMTRFTLWKDQLLHISRGLGQPIIYLEDVQHFLMANVFTTDQGFARSKDNPIKVSNFDPNLWYNPDHFSPSRKLAKESDVKLRKVFPHRKTVL